MGFSTFSRPFQCWFSNQFCQYLLNITIPPPLLMLMQSGICDFIWQYEVIQLIKTAIILADRNIRLLSQELMTTIDT